MPKQIAELCLKSNLDIINKCKDNLNLEDQSKVLYPVMIELRKLCDSCIPALKQNN